MVAYKTVLYKKVFNSYVKAVLYMDRLSLRKDNVVIQNRGFCHCVRLRIAHRIALIILCVTNIFLYYKFTNVRPTTMLSTNFPTDFCGKILKAFQHFCYDVD